MSDNLPADIGRLLEQRRWSLATAESCTGGLIAHRVTNVAGASVYFRGGIVAYSNQAKETLVEVPHETLVAHGAVSEPVAAALAEGARRVFGATHGIGVTGIAGPGGGTSEKPVGLVYIAVADAARTQVVRHVFEGTRAAVKEQTANAALELLERRLREGTGRT
jgi:nicotinamide-nucleotide amidase